LDLITTAWRAYVTIEKMPAQKNAGSRRERKAGGTLYRAMRQE
jgi:hypothetical protein